MKSYSIKIPADYSNLKQVVTFVKEKLEKLKVERKCVVRTVLAIEDVVSALIEHSEGEEEQVEVKVSSFMGKVSIVAACKGEEFNLEEVREKLAIPDADDETRGIISKLVENVLGDDISLSHRFGKNICEIKVSVSGIRTLYMTLGALGVGIFTGALIKTFCTRNVADFVTDNMLSPVYTMFLNALKLIVGPMVFFSIAESIASFKDIRLLGKIAAKIIAFYLFTSVIAICIGYGVYNLFPIGDSSLQNIITNSADSVIARSETVTVSIKDTVVNIIPSNLIDPLLKGDMLQIVFVSALVGLAVALMSGRLKGCEKFLNEGNILFGKIASIIIRFLPLAVFCSMAKLIVYMDYISAAKVFLVIPVCYFGYLSMMLVYLILLFVIGRLNPFVFAKKYAHVTFTGYALGSSSATMPYSMECCGKKLGISEKLYTIAISLGSTINMDGSCVSLMIIALFLARIFGVEITGSILFSLVAMVLILSIGAPGIPSSGLICIAFILPVVGVPLEALSLIIGVYTLIGMGNAMTNVTGDGVATAILAKKMKMMDEDVFNS